MATLSLPIEHIDISLPLSVDQHHDAIVFPKEYGMHPCQPHCKQQNFNKNFQLK